MLGLTIVVVVAVLAVGSSGGDRAVSIPQMGSPAGWFDTIFAALAFASLIGWGLIIAGMTSERGEGSGRMRPSRTIPGMLLIGFVLWFGFRNYKDNYDETVVIDAPPPSTTVATAEGTETTPSSIDLGPILAGAVLAAGAAAVIAWSARRSGTAEMARVGGTALDERRDTLIGLLDDAIAKLRAHPDPREAVIATWSRLEVAFGAVEIDREPSDTPARYLAKVLGTVDASASAVAHLTATFERAMFSPDAIDRNDQQQAVDSLVSVRDELHVLAGRSTGAGAR